MLYYTILHYRRGALSVRPCGDPWGTPLRLERRHSWALIKPPRGPNTKITSAKGHFCACPNNSGSFIVEKATEFSQNLSCDVHTHTPAPKSSTNSKLYPFLLQMSSTNCLGHGHGYECRSTKSRAFSHRPPVRRPEGWLRIKGHFQVTYRWRLSRLCFQHIIVIIIKHVIIIIICIIYIYTLIGVAYHSIACNVHVSHKRGFTCVCTFALSHAWPGR